MESRNGGIRITNVANEGRRLILLSPSRSEFSSESSRGLLAAMISVRRGRTNWVKDMGRVADSKASQVQWRTTEAVERATEVYTAMAMSQKVPRSRLEGGRMAWGRRPPSLVIHWCSLFDVTICQVSCRHLSLTRRWGPSTTLAVSSPPVGCCMRSFLSLPSVDCCMKT